MIPEPQLTYVLELLKALGSSAEDFVVAGAQAMKFMLEKARGTKDIDFVLDIMRLRAESPSIAATLATHGYTVVKESQNFQFEKPIPEAKSSCASSLWHRKSSSGRKISESTWRKAFTRDLAPAEVSLWQNLRFTRYPASFPTDRRFRLRFVSRNHTRW